MDVGKIKLLAVAFSAVAGAASAFGFGPPSTSINANGDMFVGALQCPDTGVRILTGATGRASVVAVNPIRCASVAFGNLSWPMVAKSLTSGVVHDAVWTTSGEMCGPTTLKATVSLGLVTLHGGKGTCAMSVVLTTFPPLLIEP